MKHKILFCVALLAGCSPSEVEDGQYKTLSKSQWNKVTVEVHWVSKKDISAVCIAAGADDSPNNTYSACARSKPDDSTVCEIYTTEPEDFNDSFDLDSLGHEMWHCLGATHD